MEPRAVSVDDAVEAEEAPVHIVGAVKTSVNPGNVEVDWWGLYLWKKDEGPPSAVRVTNANPLTVCSLSEPRTEVATTYDTLVPLWESVEMKAAGTHIELVDREDDHIVVFPVFEDNTVTYTVNGTQRSAFTSLQLRDDDAFHPSLVFVKANMQREVPLPLNFHPIIHPLRRLLDACAVSHNLGKEVPNIVGKWRKVPLPGSLGLQYWRCAAEKIASLRGPTKEEIREEMLLGNVGNHDNTGNPAYERLRANLAREGLREVEMAGDGHCQFRSVAHFHFGTTTEFERVRTEVTQFMKLHGDSYAPFCAEASYDVYLEHMADLRRIPACWGDHLTLQAAADLYNVTFIVVTSSEDSPTHRVRPNQEFKHSATPAEVWLSYFEGANAMHYNATEPLKKSAPVVPDVAEAEIVCVT